MNLHKEKELFKQLIDNINAKTGIDSDIIEKDYYVCMILKDLASKQDEYKAYFKGGTALYKILDTMNRFSEDIDLTVKIESEMTNNQKKKLLKKSLFGYDLDGLILIKDESEVNIGSGISIFKYDSVYSYDESLHKPGIIQIESTSFTVSEPYKKYNIEPLIYKFSDDNQKNILKSQFDVSNFEINIISLERIFVDKIFAAEFYYSRNMNYDVAKHLYDLTILYGNENIKKLLNDTKELDRLVSFKREEEKVRKGGIPADLKINDFSYFKFDYSKELLSEFVNMQNKYLLSNKYRINIETVKVALKEIFKYF